MRSKKEFFVLVLIIAAAVGYLFFRQTDRLTYELPQVAKIDTADIIKMTVKGPSGDLLLEKKSDKWQLMPKGYSADSKKIDDILATISTLTLTTVVAEKSSDSRYDLDPDQRIEVTAWDPNGIVRQFSLGKAADTFRHTFVKLPDDNRTFHAKDNFRDRFDLSPATFRDKRVMTFDSDQITSIKMTRDNKAFEWIPVESKPTESDEEKEDSASSEKQWQTIDQQAVDHTKVNQLLQKLADLNCQSFLEPEDPAVSNPPVWAVDLNSSDTSHTFTLYPEITQDEEKLWPSTSSLVSETFLLSDWQAKDIAEIVDHLTLPKKAEPGEETSKE